MPRKLAPTWIVREGCSRYGLTALQRSVLLCLWDHANADMEAWPSTGLIASETGFSDRAVKGALVTLRERAFIRRSDGRRPGERGDWSRHAVRWTVATSPREVVGNLAVVHQMH
jgi:hypothetical protein